MPLGPRCKFLAALAFGCLWARDVNILWLCAYVEVATQILWLTGTILVNRVLTAYNCTTLKHTAANTLYADDCVSKVSQVACHELPYLVACHRHGAKKVGHQKSESTGKTAQNMKFLIMRSADGIVFLNTTSLEIGMSSSISDCSASTNMNLKP